MRTLHSESWHPIDQARVVSGVEAGMAAHGVYKLDGQPDKWAQLIQGNVAKTGQAQLESITGISRRVDGAYVYGGIAVGHYGHILLETFARLYVLEETDLPVLFTSLNFTRNRLFWRVVHELGLPGERFTVLDEPAIVERLWVPPPAFQIRRSIDPAFVRAYESVGLQLGSHEATYPMPVYLSRTSTNPLGRYFHGEEIIESRLREHGVRVVHLEKYPVRQQVRDFLSWQRILGFAGTAFHHNLFAREPKEITYFDVRRINQNFRLIESQKRNRWREVILSQAADTNMTPPEGPYLLSAEAIASVCTIAGVRTRVTDISAADLLAARIRYQDALHARTKVKP